MDLHALGVFMILPTLLVAFFITVKMRRFTAELFHNLAVCCWVCANSVWMIGEFYYDDTTRPIATIFFVCGVLIMGYYYSFLHFRKQHPKLSEEPINGERQVSKTVLEYDQS
jgi:hypothetical protein